MSSLLSPLHLLLMILAGGSIAVSWTECLNRMIFFGQASLRHALVNYVALYHSERNHQGRENCLLKPLTAVGVSHAKVNRRERLGGMLSYYYGEAA